MPSDAGLGKVQAIKTLLSEQKNDRISQAGYGRCKAAVRKLGLSPVEQMHVLLGLDFASMVKRDPAFEIQYNRMLDSNRG